MSCYITMKDEENSEYFFKLFAYRQPYDCSASVKSTNEWKKSIVKEIKEFDNNKIMSSEKLRQSGKPLPNDLRYSWIKHNTEADILPPKLEVSKNLPDHLRDVVTFVPELMASVVPEVKSKIPSVKNIEKERKMLENESIKSWPIGLKILNSSTLVDPKWSTNNEDKFIKKITLSDENFHVEV